MLETKILQDLGLVDIEIANLKRKKEKYPESLTEPLYRLNNEKKNFNLFKSKYQNLVEHLSAVKGQKEVATEKLKQIQEKLREVTGTDYQKLLREQLKIKKNTSFIDRRLETTLSKVEDVKTKLEELETKYNEATEKYEEIFVTIKDKISEANDQIEILNNKRDALILKLDGDLKKNYLQAYKSGHGNGVAFLSENRCGACNITLPLNLSIKILKQEEIVRCPNCGRLLITNANSEEKTL